VRRGKFYLITATIRPKKTEQNERNLGRRAAVTADRAGTARLRAWPYIFSVEGGLILAGDGKKWTDRDERR